MRGCWSRNMMKAIPGLLARASAHQRRLFLRAPSEGARCKNNAGSQKRRAAAYGVGRDSIAEGAAVECPVRHSSQRRRFREDCPVKKA